ncbi:MAG: histidinol-phosphate transaminase [Ruminococcaceae bacterium]|nr:histidinol-phosphate transaminase [Oscillospiraceae bacterium]
MSRYLKENYQALEEYTPGEQPKDGEYIKLNTNESPFPPAPSVVEALKGEDVEKLRLYSDPTMSVLKGKLANLYGVKDENIYLSNGSDDILNFAFMAFGQDGAVFPEITYGFYSVFAELHGIGYECVPLREDFTVDYKDYLKRDKLVVIANPNAPTGDMRPLWEIEEIIKSNPDNVVVIDEAYVDFGGESAYPLIDKYDNLLVVRTFSKSRCMAGARLGYAIASKGIISDLEKLKYSTNPYNINRLTATLGEATVDAEEYYQEKCKEIMSVREYTKERLEAMGFLVLSSKANFLFAKHNKINGEKLYLELKARHILVRHFTNDKIKNFNRITIGTKEQMDKLLEATQEILKGETI